MRLELDLFRLAHQSGIRYGGCRLCLELYLKYVECGFCISDFDMQLIYDNCNTKVEYYFSLSTFLGEMLSELRFSRTSSLSIFRKPFSWLESVDVIFSIAFFFLSGSFSL